MKLSRKLVPAIAMLLVSAVMLSTASFAWFSMNTTVSASGMQVQAQAMGSMIISATAIPDASTLTTTIAAKDASSSVETLKDVTRTDSSATSGLMTIPAALRQFVAPDTGLYNTTDAQAAVDASTEDALEEIYTQIPATDETGYFKDYVVYISARADAIETTGKKLRATILNTDTDKYHEGISIDFYVTRVSWTGNTPAAEPTDHPVYAAATVKTATYTSSQVDIDLAGTIPVAKGTANATEFGYLKVVMRVYINGAVGDVNNSQWEATPETNISVQFDLVTPGA